jgi:hypothetical protein
MLKIIDIHTYYGESYILQGISLEVANRKVVGILGRNGVGKTTMIDHWVYPTAERPDLFQGDRYHHLALPLDRPPENGSGPAGAPYPSPINFYLITGGVRNGFAFFIASSPYACFLPLIVNFEG